MISSSQTVTCTCNVCTVYHYFEEIKQKKKQWRIQGTMELIPRES